MANGQPAEYMGLWTRLEREGFVLVYALPHKNNEAFSPEASGWLPSGETFVFSVEFGKASFAVGPAMNDATFRARAEQFWNWVRGSWQPRRLSERLIKRGWWRR
ncbi:MAG: hypothetical protein LC808_30230 [Actinobacteria bacterium]|nr:hypothetical protein [Actinomycetota bacterium]